MKDQPLPLAFAERLLEASHSHPPAALGAAARQKVHQGGAWAGLYHFLGYAGIPACGEWGCERASPLALPAKGAAPPLETPKAGGRQRRASHRCMPLGAESGCCVPRSTPAAQQFRVFPFVPSRFRFAF